MPTEKNSDVSTDLQLQIIDAIDKLKELLHCGNERVELSAAKELLALAEEQAVRKTDQEETTAFTVEISVRTD